MDPYAYQWRGSDLTTLAMVPSGCIDTATQPQCMPRDATADPHHTSDVGASEPFRYARNHTMGPARLDYTVMQDRGGGSQTLWVSVRTSSLLAVIVRGFGRQRRVSVVRRVCVVVRIGSGGRSMRASTVAYITGAMLHTR